MFGKIVYSKGEYYHPHVDTAWGYNEQRNALITFYAHVLDNVIQIM